MNFHPAWFIGLLATIFNLEARAILDIESYQIRSISDFKSLSAKIAIKHMPMSPAARETPFLSDEVFALKPSHIRQENVFERVPAPLRPSITSALPSDLAHKKDTASVTTPFLEKKNEPLIISMPQIDVSRNKRIEAVVATLDKHIKSVLGKTDVHQLVPYYRPLWAGLSCLDILGYTDRNSEEFKEKFNLAVKELEFVLQHVNSDVSVDFGDKKVVLKRAKTPYNRTNLELAFNKIKNFGRHASASDWDNEVYAHANEVLVYVWNRVKENPEELVPLLLEKLEDAAPTCIQGHTVRMLNTIHSYEERFYSPLYEGNVSLLP